MIIPAIDAAKEKLKDEGLDVAFKALAGSSSYHKRYGDGGARAQDEREQGRYAQMPGGWLAESFKKIAGGTLRSGTWRDDMRDTGESATSISLMAEDPLLKDLVDLWRRRQAHVNGLDRVAQRRVPGMEVTSIALWLEVYGETGRAMMKELLELNIQGATDRERIEVVKQYGQPLNELNRDKHGVYVLLAGSVWKIGETCAKGGFATRNRAYSTLGGYPSNMQVVIATEQDALQVEHVMLLFPLREDAVISGADGTMPISAGYILACLESVLVMAVYADGTGVGNPSHGRAVNGPNGSKLRLRAAHS